MSTGVGSVVRRPSVDETDVGTLVDGVGADSTKSNGTAGPAARRRRYPVELPRLTDARLHTATVLLTVQVLGQVALGFELSIAQILASILTCAVIEVAVVFRRRRVIAWPASAMLTGNGIALLMRAEGTAHGDWWSLHNIWIFIAVAALAMATKYHIRIGERHVFNPSNVALVAAFLVLGSQLVNPQDFWWGPPSIGLAMTYAVLLVGGVLITRRLGLLACAASYWVTLAIAVGLVAVTGHAISARWSFEPVEGFALWWVIVGSPEILIFLFFMITDPRTTPTGRVGRILFGTAVGLAGGLFLAPQTTEFAAKVAVLAGLTVVSLLRPAIERWSPLPGSEEDRFTTWARATLAPTGPGLRQTPAAFRTLGLGLAAAAAAILVGASTTHAPGQATSAGAPRPAVQVESPALDQVVVDPSVDRLNADVDRDDAQAIAHDFLASLQLEQQALDSGDVELARAATTGARLERNLELIDNGSEREAPGEFERLVVTIVRSDPQAVPAFGIEAHTGSSSFTQEYELALVGGHYLVSSGP